jgi:serine/threonine protein kinase
VDFFEGTEGRAMKTFHQVFEFIDNGKPLTKFIEELEALGPVAQWDQRVRFARVMMMGIQALHGQKIVHTDLKPDNLLLIPNPHAPGEYHLKIIDLDWSIFADQRAPWHGEDGQGYVGTPMYMSPEHVSGRVPDERSDVFTCALMLGELLGGGHPFARVTSYPEAIKRGGFERFRLGQAVPKVENTAYLEELVNRALSPDAADRPTAAELRDALFGKGKAGEASRPAPAPSPAVPAAPPPAADKPTAPRPSSSLPADVVELTFEGRPALRMGIDTTIGRELLKPISPDAQFASEAQFRIHRSPSKEWMVSPVPGAHNETLVDGVKLTAPTRLRAGMRIAIGNSAKGIEKLPLIVKGA